MFSQELHTVQLYCNNQFTREVITIDIIDIITITTIIIIMTMAILHKVAVFQEVRAYFSIGGTIYHSDPVSFNPLPDEIFEVWWSTNVEKISEKNDHNRIVDFIRADPVTF